MKADTQSMIVAKDQFWSWAMILARRADSIESVSSSVGGSRYSFFQARNALYHSIKLLGIEPAAHILVPAYICRAAVDPLMAYGLIVDFYGVTRDCAPDYEDLERRITARTKAVLAVHYFGFPQSIGRMRRLCDAHNMALIEDCAHVLCGETDEGPMGSVGDAAVFSWRKFLPVYDGAELVLNKPVERHPIEFTKESGLFTLRVAANMLDASLREARQPLLKFVHRTMRAGEAVFRRYAKSHIPSNPMMQVEATSVEFNVQNVHWPMSRLSRWTREHADVRNITEKRRHNYEVLLRELSELPLRPVFSSLPARGCPWVFPVIFNKLSPAHLLLRQNGIPAVTWGGVRHPGIPRSSESDFLYENLVFLPIHQCLQDEDMLKMAQKIRELCGK